MGAFRDLELAEKEKEQIMVKEKTKETVEKARKTIRLIADKLKESHNPKKIILFGSYAWGMPDEDSDIDLLVIKDTKERPHRRNVNARKLVSSLRRGYGLDILVITPEELKSRLEIGDQFLQEIISRGEVLHGYFRARQGRSCGSFGDG